MNNEKNAHYKEYLEDAEAKEKTKQKKNDKDEKELNEENEDSDISSGYVLNINSHQSFSNPFDQSKNKKLNPKNQLEGLKIIDYKNSSTVLILTSCVMLSIYYGIIIFLKLDFICIKVYHSFSIGIIALIDKLFFIKSSFQVKNSLTDFFINHNAEHLLDSSKIKKGKGHHEEKILKLIKKYIIAAGILIFLIEIIIFCILKRAELLRINASLGLMIIGVELLLIQINQIFVGSLGFINKFALFLAIFVSILSVILYLDFTFLFLGLIAAFLKYINLFILQYVRFISKTYYFLHWINFIDFTLGLLVFSVIIISQQTFTLYKISHISLIFLGSLCYYLNLKFFYKHNK